MTEVLFYQLQRQRPEEALPLLVEKTLEKGWKAFVRAGSAERLAALDAALWTWREESFLPHGRREDGEPETQPCLLALDGEADNAAEVTFLIDRAPLPDAIAGERLVLMFDGEDPDALDEARAAWKAVKSQGHSATYWQQEGGRWVKKA